MCNLLNNVFHIIDRDNIPPKYIYIYTWLESKWIDVAWQPPPEFLPGESHGQKSLEGCSP